MGSHINTVLLHQKLAAPGDVSTLSMVFSAKAGLQHNPKQLSCILCSCHCYMDVSVVTYHNCFDAELFCQTYKLVLQAASL